MEAGLADQLRMERRREQPTLSQDLGPALVRSEKGAVAVPSDFITVSELPETRSGKYVRRLLAALTRGADPGDLSSLRNPDAVREIEPKVTAWRDREAEKR